MYALRAVLRAIPFLVPLFPPLHLPFIFLPSLYFRLRRPAADMLAIFLAPYFLRPIFAATAPPIALAFLADIPFFS